MLWPSESPGSGGCMTLLNKAAILAATDIKTEDVEVPEWGGTVRVRTISAAESMATNTEALKDGQGDPAFMTAHLLSSCLIAEDGASEAWTAEDLRALAK